MRAALPRDAIVVKDATIPAYTWGNRLLEVYEPRTAMNSTSLAIGPGLPLAVGGGNGRPGPPVVLIVGAGGVTLKNGALGPADLGKRPLGLLLFYLDGSCGVPH